MRAVLVYGAGGFGRRLAAALREGGFEVLAHIDQRAEGLVDGIPIRRIDQASQFRDVPVAIGIFNPMVDPLEISVQLETSGFLEIWSPVAAMRKLAEVKVPFTQYWLTNEPDIETGNLKVIEKVDSAWSDQKSRHVYRALLQYRRSGDPRALPAVDGMECQYCPPDVPLNFVGDITLVDGGAYDGDTLRALARRGIGLGSVFAFEPDPGNYGKLAATAKSLTCSKVVCVPCGLGEVNRQVRFNASGQASASVSAEGDLTIQLVGLDQTLTGMQIDYIKLDVEGSELDALRGGEEIIRRFRPRLAISAYHRPEDLWRLSDWLLNLDVGYSLYLRAHAFQGFDSVIYAVPTQ